MVGDEVEESENDTHGGVPVLNVGPEAGFSVSQAPGGVSNHMIVVPTFGPHTFTVSLLNVLPEDTWTSTSAPTVSVEGGGCGAELSCATVTAPLPVASTVAVTPVVGFLLSTVPVDPVVEEDVPVATSFDVEGGVGGVGGLGGVGGVGGATPR
jgi:hypothetical protein